MQANLPGVGAEAEDLQLPALRQDLRLIEGGAEGVTEDLWRIHDPLAQRFFEVGQEALDLLALWHAGSLSRLRTLYLAQHGRTVDESQVKTLIEFLQRHELLHPQPGLNFAHAQRQKAASKKPWWSKLLHGYLFIRVPLARPDRFLRATLPMMGLFFRPSFWYLQAVLAAVGLYLVSRQWETFLSTLPDMLSVSGAAVFAISLALVKTLHELGHGYTAVRMGSRVSSMGVALIVMMPVLYTDTTDAWRLQNRRQRVLIDAAGMAVELMIAVLATLFWVFLPDGALRHAAFALATTGWVLSLAINLNPLMRFDGYYLFSDLIGIANLQERSFAMGRWWLREKLFGYGDPLPESCTVSRRRFLVGFAFAVWIYRFFLFLGIALLVYHFFFKVLGIFMFAVELGWFIVLPIWRELKVWWSRRGDTGPRVRWTALVTLALLAVLFTPLPYTVRIPAVLTAAVQQPSFAPRPAQIDTVLVQRGEQVKAGQVLIRLVAPELDQQLDSAQQRSRLLEERLGRRTVDRSDLSDSLVLARELLLELERISGLQRERGRLELRAPIDGVVIELAEELSPGRWVGASERLVLVARTGVLQARGYLDSEDLGRVNEGQGGRSVDENFSLPSIDVQIQHIGAAASQVLDNWLLASVHGGSVASRLEKSAAWPEHAVFEITAQAEGAPAAPLTEVRGEIQIKGQAQSLATRVVRRVVRVLVRESTA